MAANKIRMSMVDLESFDRDSIHSTDVLNSEESYEDEQDSPKLPQDLGGPSRSSNALIQVENFNLLHDSGKFKSTSSLAQSTSSSKSSGSYKESQLWIRLKYLTINNNYLISFWGVIYVALFAYLIFTLDFIWDIKPPGKIKYFPSNCSNTTRLNSTNNNGVSFALL